MPNSEPDQPRTFNAEWIADVEQRVDAHRDILRAMMGALAGAAPGAGARIRDALMERLQRTREADALVGDLWLLEVATIVPGVP